MVATPGGWLPKSHVFLVENGYHLDVTTGHVLKVSDETGKIMADFGEIHTSTLSHVMRYPTSVDKGMSRAAHVPSTDGWATFALAPHLPPR